MLLLGARCQDAPKELIQEAQGCFLSLQLLPTLEGPNGFLHHDLSAFFLRSNWRGEENLENGVFPESPVKQMSLEEKINCIWCCQGWLLDAVKQGKQFGHWIQQNESPENLPKVISVA